MLDPWVPWAILGYLLFALLANLAVRGPRPDIWTGLGFAVLRAYARLVHRLRVQGREHAPTPASRGRAPRPLIVVANHAAGIDPLLVQAAMPRVFIRWMMGADMRVPGVDFFWRFADVIFVDRTGQPDVSGLREMLSHLRRGGVLGVFPEGRLRRPGAPLGAFQPGVGVLVARTGALVLPAVISGVPRTPTAWGSITRSSRSQVRFHAPIDYAALGLAPADIAADLRARYLVWLSEAAEA